MADTTAKAIAAKLGIDPKRMRRFIRETAKTDAAVIGACGQGNRYAISARDADRLVRAFLKAHPSHVMPKAHAPKAPKAQAPAVAPVPVADSDADVS